MQKQSFARKLISLVDPRNYLRNNFFLTTNSILGQKGAIWIDTDDAYRIYNTIPQLKAVINRKSSMFSNMELYLIDVKSGKRLEDKELDKLLQNPNPLQSQNAFLKQFKEQEQVYGNQFIYKNKPSTLLKYPLTLWNISPALVQPVLSGKIFEQTSIEEIITGYDYRLTSYEKRFNPEEILYSRITDLDTSIIGTSCVKSLKYPLSNIEAAYEFRNVVMKEKGALGILSNNNKDAMGGIPLNSDERKKIEDTYINKYGIGAEQSRIILTESSLNWTPMSYPTKDMMLFEEVDADLITIIDSLGLNVNMFSNKNATFENVKNSIIQAYQDTIIPEADSFTQSLSKFIGVKDGQRLVASYDHLPIMKENNLKGMQSIQIVVETLNSAVTGGLLTPQQATAILSTELGIS